MSDTQTEAPVVVGGPYVEDEDFVPNPTDMTGTFNTEGVGAHHDPSTVSPIFDIDKAAVAAEIVAALDPDDTSVSSDRVLFTRPQTIAQVDPEAEREELLSTAKARLEEPVVVGGTGEEGPDREKQAAKEGDEDKTGDAPRSGEGSKSEDPKKAPAKRV